MDGGDVMTTFGGPGGLSSSPGDPHEYEFWDAAYVLGSLSSSERREFEAHLSTCMSCLEAVSELSGMPALLAQLDREYVAAMDERGAYALAALPPLRHGLWASLLAKVSRRRRRARLLNWTLAAAAVLAIGMFVAIRPNPVALPPGPEQADASALTMTPVKPIPLTATVSLSRRDWGTRIEMNCIYGVGPVDTDYDGDEAGDKLAMVAVGRDGSHVQLATWTALTGIPASPGGSTSMPMDQIASVEIISADAGAVLLQRNL
jgi:hypothetical protein